MQYELFHKQLRETGTYETPPDLRLSILDRLLGRFDAWCYIKIFAAILHGFLQAVFGKFGRDAWARRAYDILMIIEQTGARVHISGVQHVAALTKPVVFVANHMSSIETLLGPGLALPHQDLIAVVKESLMHYPFFGRILRSIDTIHVSRKNPRADLKQVLLQGEAALRAGRSVMLFPQSTRNPIFCGRDFHTLGIKLAHRAGVPILPLAVKTDFHQIGGQLRDFGRIDRSKPVYFEFGEPLPLQGNGRGQHVQVIRFIEDCLRKWGAVIRE